MYQFEHFWLGLQLLRQLGLQLLLLRSPTFASNFCAVQLNAGSSDFCEKYSLENISRIFDASCDQYWSSKDIDNLDNPKYAEWTNFNDYIFVLYSWYFDCLILLA